MLVQPAPGTHRQPLATSVFRVTMGDTDAARVIFFGAPIRWAERLVTTWLADNGNPTSRAISEGFGLPAVHAEINYTSPLRLDDLIQGSLWVHDRTTRTVTFRSEFAHQDETDPAVVVRVTQVQVAMADDEIRAIPLRPELVAELARGDLAPRP